MATMLTLLLPLAALHGAAALEIFVSPDGTGNGTLEAPLGDIQAAVDAAAAGDTIFLRDGTYAPAANIQISVSGEVTAPITIRPYEGEKVVVDGENMPGCAASHLVGGSAWLMFQ